MLNTYPCLFQLNPEQKCFDCRINGLSSSQSATGLARSALMRCRYFAPGNMLMIKILFYFVMKRRKILA